ncbi:hypothetical protein Mapa_003891 [Marchantia paleacea]|nr:hypothetical protein Mapa_003891 [Marchantia paleacea]
MSWTLGSWKRQADIFHLILGYGDQESGGVDDLPLRLRNGVQPLDLKFPLGGPADLISACKYKIQLDWAAGDDEDQVALKLQSQLMVTLPSPHDEVAVRIGQFVDTKNTEETDLPESDADPQAVPEDEVEVESDVRVIFNVYKTREHLKLVSLSRTVGSGPSVDGLGVLNRILDKFANSSAPEEVSGFTEHWRVLSVLNLSNCSLTGLPIELARLPMLQRLYLDNNKITVLPPELGQLKQLKVLRADHNLLTSVPVELRQCLGLVELSLEHNKLVRPLLDFRAMSELQVLRLFGNPLEFLPEILPCTKLRHLSLANVRIEADESLMDINVEVEGVESTSYFAASKHKLSAFFSLIFRFSSCQHPLLASALAKITQDNSNRAAIGKDESAVRQLLSMILSDNRHVVEQACIALSALAVDTTLVLRLMRADVVQAIEFVLRSTSTELLISVLKVVVNIAFTSDAVAAKVLTKDIFKRLKALCSHTNSEVQRQALMAIGNLAFSWENRRTLVASETLREMLLRLSSGQETRVCKAAARALAILGENEYLRRAIKGKPVAKRGLRILSMDGGGMRGLATVEILRKFEKYSGKHIHEMFDLICGTSTGGMLAVALGIKQLSLDQCEEIYKTLGKVVFAEPPPKENEAATWREKIDSLYKSSSQSFRVVVHGSKHNADEFERLLKEMCADEDGDLLIESAVRKEVPKVFAVSTLVSVVPAQPFVFRNYQYPPGTPETAPWTTDGPAASVSGSAATAAPLSTPIGPKRSAFIGSCKHYVWEAIRASSAAPYYLDDYSSESNRWQDGAIVANNPTIIALREAQLLWPDVPIGCLVSLGCGNVPNKPRGKGGWRYLDTGQVLIESACSVERAEEALDALLPLVDGIRYFRFNPVDDRCGMELDETDPVVWGRLEAATREYLEAHDSYIKEACDTLEPPSQSEDAWYERHKNGRFSTPGKQVNKGSGDATGLGWRRRVLLAEVRRSPDLLKPFRHTRALEAYCDRYNIKLDHLITVPTSTIASTTTGPTPPYASPSFTGSFPTSPLLFSPDPALLLQAKLENLPPLNLDGGHGPSSHKIPHSPPLSPPRGPRELTGPVLALHEKLRSSPQLGIVHLALHSDLSGLIMSWKSDIVSVAEPGEMAEGFLQTVVANMRIGVTSKARKKRSSHLPKFSSLSSLVAACPRFMIGGALHRFMGRHTQVLPDGQEVGSYLFRRTLPASHLVPDDVRWMVGGWRDRIVICTGRYGPPAALVKAFLDSGAKAVIVPAVDPLEMHRNFCDGKVGDNEGVDNDDGRFVIEDEDDEEEAEPSSPGSDWEDSDFDKMDSNFESQEREEKDLASFVGTLYDALFRDGLGAEAALQHALEAHVKQQYRCHLPHVY